MTEDWWRPARFQARRPALEMRAKAKRALAHWFDDAGFIEVETPALQISPGIETHLMAFETRLTQPGHYGIADRQDAVRYLHTSPEFTMKKLLAGGMEKIWQLCPVYRNAEGSSLHSPEFHMLEWYRVGAGYDQLINDGEAIIARLASDCGIETLQHGDRHCDPRAPFERLRVADAFQRYCEVDLDGLIRENPASPDPEALQQAAARLNLRTAADDRFDDLFFRLMDHCIEPNLGDGAVCALMDYPISMAALARPKPSDPIWAERVEFYACGIELANGFGELTDGAEQRKRFEAETKEKRALYGAAYPIDPGFIEAVGAMPPASGMALGFDRLVMLMAGADSIDWVRWAPVDR